MVKSRRIVCVRLTILWGWRLSLSWGRPLAYRNQSIDLHCKSMDWFLYDNGLPYERIKGSRLMLTKWTIFRHRHVQDTKIKENLYSLAMVSKFRFQYGADLSELINFKYVANYQKPWIFPLFEGRIERIEVDSLKFA